MACLLHKWDGCKCEKCGKTRNSHHNFHKIHNLCIQKCVICGHEEALEHKFVDGVCSCGAYKNYVGYYLVGEKPDLSKKADNISDFSRTSLPDDFLKKTAKETWGGWQNTQITFGFSPIYQLFFKSYEQLIATNPKFVEQTKPVGVVSTSIDTERSWIGNSGIVNDLSNDFTVALNNYLIDHKEMVLESDFYYIQGSEQFTQPSQMSFSYVPKWKIAIFFFHKKAGGVNIRFEPFQGSGICDVCGKSLNDTAAYIVPNEVFYNSPRYKIWFRTNLRSFTSQDVSDAAAAQMFAEMQAKDKESHGSAVCGDCVYMFE